MNIFPSIDQALIIKPSLRLSFAFFRRSFLKDVKFSLMKIRPWPTITRVAVDAFGYMSDTLMFFGLVHALYNLPFAL